MIEERRLIKEIAIPEGVTVEISGKKVTIKGPLGELSKEISDPTIFVEVKENKLIIKPKKFSKKQKMMINTFYAHLNNMLKGVKEEFIYKLKICSGHFPMATNIEGNILVVKNFFGEKVPRKAKILPNVKVQVKGDEVIVTGIDIEVVSQTAANIESCTSIKNRDRRVFQDGIWLMEKAGKKVGA
ncbi:MAG: 50S ribosomal protein L6 [Nanoarchaeota archaeon]|nr:50S ribosomal protein L6 [Nanoarchaeota archaeon]MBU4242101.1 50S ribosomal protein L6 [Nanoarchaeota archaeon]MBU4352462.1 50S ribosomal protein L6 [Nanoarchaeota archaeon]